MMKDESSEHTIRAAGGILWRDAAEGRLVAVIHRPRHQDWSLPKGKLEAGESWRDAAKREVREETGCDVELGSFAGSVRYPVAGTTKEVRFWNMRPRGACAFQPSEEVDRLEWLTIDAALERLHHAGERALVVANKDAGTGGA